MNDINILTLPKIIKSMIIGSLFGGLNRRIKISLPLVIDGYKLIENSNAKVKSRIFRFAIYENDKGDKALAKIWAGKFRDYGYLTLANEIAFHKTAYKVLKREKSSLSKYFKNVSIPKYLASLENENLLILLTEYMVGKPANISSSSKAFAAYIRSADFLKYLGKKMNDKEKQCISKRTIAHIIFLYPSFLIKAIIHKPHFFPELIKGIPIVFNSLPSLVKRKEIALSHRDLHLKNILINKNCVYLIDLEFCIFSDEIYDILSTLRGSFSNETFRGSVMEELNKRFSHNKEYKSWFNGLMVISMTHGLSGTNIPKDCDKRCINYLKSVSKTEPKNAINRNFSESIATFN